MTTMFINPRHATLSCA